MAAGWPVEERNDVWRTERGKDLRDAIAFTSGLAIVVNEAFFGNPPLDRIGVLGAGLALMGYGVGKFNGRHHE
jgi:hypothetical protein